MDEGLISLQTEKEAIDLLRSLQASLAEANLRLHQFASNSTEVLNAFPSNDHAKDVKHLDLDEEVAPTQRSLGLIWEVAAATFTFQVSISDKPFTRHGVLSTLSSLFDPLGMAAAFTLQGRFLLRSLSTEPGTRPCHKTNALNGRHGETPYKT